jgi:tripartite-type tricarboxylate transporter receptor subunit TctC
MATSGSGSVGHLAGEMFATQAGIKFVHVPYKGAAPAMTDLLGGQTDFLLTVPQTTAPMVAAGKLRALGVTSDSRLPILPNVPTVAEQGYPGFQANDWKVLVGPAGMPPTIVKRLHAEVEKVLGSASAIAALIVEGSTPLSGTSSAAGAFIRAEHARWVTAIRQADVKPE